MDTNLVITIKNLERDHEKLVADAIRLQEQADDLTQRARKIFTAIKSLKAVETDNAIIGLVQRLTTPTATIEAPRGQNHSDFFTVVNDYPSLNPIEAVKEYVKSVEPNRPTIKDVYEGLVKFGYQFRKDIPEHDRHRGLSRTIRNAIKKEMGIEIDEKEGLYLV